MTRLWAFADSPPEFTTPLGTARFWAPFGDFSRPGPPRAESSTSVLIQVKIQQKKTMAQTQSRTNRKNAFIEIQKRKKISMCICGSPRPTRHAPGGVRGWPEPET